VWFGVSGLCSFFSLNKHGDFKTYIYLYIMSYCLIVLLPLFLVATKAFSNKTKFGYFHNRVLLRVLIQKWT